MNRIEYKEGVIWCGEEKASNPIIYIGCLPVRTKLEKQKKKRAI